MWQMEFNPDKCEVLRITLNTKRIITGSYLIHGKVLNLVPSAQYLGITIDSKLTFNEHVDNICKKPTLHVPLSLGIQKNAQSKSKLWCNFCTPTVGVCVLIMVASHQTSGRIMRGPGWARPPRKSWRPP